MVHQLKKTCIFPKKKNKFTVAYMWNLKHSVFISILYLWDYLVMMFLRGYLITAVGKKNSTNDNM